MSAVRVEKPGLLSTVQDLGRPGYAHLGISASGAADALALRLGNLAVGNEHDAPAIEMTLVGGTFGFEADAVVAITGADFGPRLATRTIPRWQAVEVRRGDRLELGPSRSGARCYLCVRGGIDVPRVFGSASTHVLTGIGGWHGRPLAAGDVLPIGAPSRAGACRSLDLRWIESAYAPAPLRITRGPQADWFDDGMLDRLRSSTYSVLEQSNRMGIRLVGPAITRASTRQLVTEGVALGAIQIPESGQPIVLFVEHQTTGGYPKIAAVCTADMHRVGQLRPRDRVGFELRTLEEAWALDRELEWVARALGSTEAA